MICWARNNKVMCNLGVAVCFWLQIESWCTFSDYLERNYGVESFRLKYNLYFRQIKVVQFQWFGSEARFESRRTDPWKWAIILLQTIRCFTWRPRWWPNVWVCITTWDFWWVYSRDLSPHFYLSRVPICFAVPFHQPCITLYSSVVALFP